MGCYPDAGWARDLVGAMAEGLVHETVSTATRLRPLRFHRRPDGHNPVGVVFISPRLPKVGADAPTLGWRPQSLWDWQRIPLLDILAPCHNHFRRCIFIWFFRPRIDGHSCAIKLREKLCTPILGVFQNSLIVHRCRSVAWKITYICLYGSVGRSRRRNG